MPVTSSGSGCQVAPPSVESSTESRSVDSVLTNEEKPTSTGAPAGGPLVSVLVVAAALAGEPGPGRRRAP